MKHGTGFDFFEIANKFSFEGELIEAMPYGCGHINDTFAAYFRKQDGSVHRYILQRINRNVFKNPERLMDNIDAVTSFMRGKMQKAGGDPDRECLTLIPTLDGKNYFKSESGDYWRGYIFIENAESVQVPENPRQLYHAGKAFGRFQALLSDYPAGTLFETIPNFHNTRSRFEQLTEAVEKDCMNRARSVKREIEFAFDRADECGMLVTLYEKGELPLRVTHNDTKLNNVLLDNKTGEGVCVIDLDTVMQGLSLYDFGDAIRTGANPATEDEKDLSKVCIDLAMFEQFTKGFLCSVGGSLTAAEIKHLPVSAKIMTYECGIRFLTDYLNGDTYFKIKHLEHNLDRCRTQFALVTDMERKMKQMEELVESYYKREGNEND